MEEITCSHCNTPINDTYCAHCGQKYTPKRIGFLTIGADFISQLFSLERSGFATFIQLIKNPKKIIEN